MKKTILACFCFSLLLLMAGCGGKSSSSNDLAEKAATEDAIEAYIAERVTEECRNILYAEDTDAAGDGRAISVLIVNGQATVTIRVHADFCIPAAAEELLPVALEALGENDTDLGKISFTYYKKNNSGIVEGSMVDWTTRDGEKGTFASGPDDVTNTGYTLEDLQEYYEGYEEIVEKLRSGED